MQLSIIIPVYNAEVYLKACLDSIVQEMNEQTEVLLIDDGSKDHTSLIYNTYKDKIHIFQNKNHGVSYARNFGMKHASGKYIMFVDADDVLIKGWQQKINNFLSSSADILYFSKYKVSSNISQNDVIQSIIGYPQNKILTPLSAVWSKLFKRQFLLKNNLSFSENIINGEDMLFNLKAILCTDSFRFVEASIYQYRIHFHSATHVFEKKIFDSNILFLKQFYRILKDDPSIFHDFQKYYDCCLFNSIYIFLYRISRIEKKQERKQIYPIFEESIYANFLKRYHSQYIYGMYKNMILFLIKHKLYNQAIFIMRMKEKIGMRHHKKEVLEEI